MLEAGPVRGEVETSGWDFGLNWLGPDMSWGRFGVNWNSTYVNDYSAVSVETGQFEPQRVGVEVTDSGIARLRSTLRLNWSFAGPQLGRCVTHPR